MRRVDLEEVAEAEEDSGVVEDVEVEEEEMVALMAVLGEAEEMDVLVVIGGEEVASEEADGMEIDLEVEILAGGVIRLAVAAVVVVEEDHQGDLEALVVVAVDQITDPDHQWVVQDVRDLKIFLEISFFIFYIFSCFCS